jgi:hypothetical protein
LQVIHGDSISTQSKASPLDSEVGVFFDSIVPSLTAILDRGRSAAKGPPLPKHERALVAVSAVNLCFLPWALGGMHPWSQILSLVFSAIGFAIAMLRRPGDDLTVPAARLVRFPVFWAGLLVLVYVAVQGVNPSWRFVADSKSWWLVPVSHNLLLPSGVDAPFARSNPWRAIVLFGSVWLLVCSIWVGFHRRQSFRLLAGITVFSGALLALVGLFQQITGTNRIFWEYQAPLTAQFVASFIYRNHAGAYFNLVLALATAMAAWHWRRSRRRIGGPGAAVAFGFAAALIGLAVIFSASRMSIIVMIAFTLIVALAAGFMPSSDAGHKPRRPWRFIVLPALCILAIVWVTFEASGVWHRIAGLVANPTATLQSRTLARKAAEEMFLDRWVYGWGAGCFRYGFPLYQQHYPEIYTGASGRMYWEHAHDDLLEFPLELGALGMIPVVAALGYAAWRALRARVWQNPFSVCVIAGCLLTVVHAWVDFVFQNPAVLATWAFLLVAAVRWSELESSIERRRPSS